MKSELQHSKRVAISYLAVRLSGSHCPVRIFSTAANYELANAMLGVRFTARVLRCKTLVVMIVSVDDQIRTRVIERVPQRFHQEIVSVSAAGTEQGLVKICEGAARRMLSQILPQPHSLWRGRVAATHMSTLAVQGEDVPGSKIVAVVPLLGISCRGAKVSVVR